MTLKQRMIEMLLFTDPLSKTLSGKLNVKAIMLNYTIKLIFQESNEDASLNEKCLKNPNYQITE